MNADPSILCDPFKSNATGGVGGMYQMMLHYFSFKREEFLAHYYTRNNVESTFSMIKAKFRNDAPSKDEAAMINEVLCKLVCHNIFVLIQEMYDSALNWDSGERKLTKECPLLSCRTVRHSQRVRRA